MADSGAHERPPGHRSGPMGTARTQGTHGVGRQRPGPFGSGQAPPRADHRPPRRLRWPISPSRPGYPGSPGGRWLRLAGRRSWAFWVGDTIAGLAGYGVADPEAPTPTAGQTQPSAQGGCRSQKPGGRNGPSEAPRRPMVGPGRCQAAPTGPSRSPPALQVPGATSRPLRAPHDRPGGHTRPDSAAMGANRLAAASLPRPRIGGVWPTHVPPRSWGAPGSPLGSCPVVWAALAAWGAL